MLICSLTVQNKNVNIQVNLPSIKDQRLMALFHGLPKFKNKTNI